MSGSPSLRPQPGEHGLASADAAGTAALAAGCWDGLIELATLLPLDSPSRLPGWTVRDVLAHLGSWPEHERFSAMLQDARRDRPHHRDDVDARNAMLVAAHGDADAGELAAALRWARDAVTGFLESAQAGTVGQRWTASAAGPLPVAGVLLAACHELAVHALDVADPAQVPAQVLDAGIAALVDTVGALAARCGLSTSVAVITPGCGWAVGVQDGSWSTHRLGPEVPVRELGWPAVAGAAADVLDASAGRVSGAALLLSRRLRTHHTPALLDLLPAVQETAGLPGGVALRAAALAAAGAGRLVGRLGGLTGLR